MAPIPREVLLNQAVKLLDGEIAAEWGRINQVIKANPQKTPSKDLIGEFKRVRNLMTRRHALELERTYPRAKIVYEARWVGVQTADGEFVRVKELRISDAGIVVDDHFAGIEVKTEKAILDAVSKAGGDAKIVTDFNKSSKLGDELSKEKRVLGWAKRNGISLWIEGRDPVTLEKIEQGFPVENVKGSRSQSYNNMGDGIELSSFFDTKKGSGNGTKPTVQSNGQAALPNKSVKPAADRLAESSKKAVENRALESNGVETKSQTKQNSKINITDETISAQAFPVDPNGVLAEHARTTSAIEGGALMVYQYQLGSLAESARKKAESAVAALDTQIERYRSRGEWVLVRVTFAEAESQDVFGLSTDSYPIFWSAHLLHAETVNDPITGQFDLDWQMRVLRNPPQSYEAVEKQPSANPPRSVPPGRKLVGYDYALHLPRLKVPEADRSMFSMPRSKPTSIFEQQRCTADRFTK